MSRYTRAEELANSITHGVGLVLSIASAAVLVVLAGQRGGVWHIVSCSIYGLTLILLFCFSTVYHLLAEGRAKRVMRVFDHSSIFLLIAGTYTPFLLVSLRGGWGWTLFGLVWGLALAGVVGEICWTDRFRRVSVPIYLLMGWLIVVAFRPLMAQVATGGLVLLAAGGAAYTVGVIFYAWRRLPYGHAAWHLFVLAGSICHYLGIALYVVLRHP